MVNRRQGTYVLLAAGLIGAAGSVQAHPAVAASTTQPPYFASIDTLEQAMLARRTSALALTQDFIERIATLDQAGPAVNAVIELNPDALEIARERDLARDAGGHGPLLGIPVLLKDNIDTADRMQTTAGSLAMVGEPAAVDATVVQRLRHAGAVILGKTNLSEWANFRSTHSSSGWSARGGQTSNPYVLNRNPCGSSAGSGAAVAAGFATVALGTETDGSVICPAAANGIVGIKPTVGLVSRAGIIPISHSQDTAGPMARTVADAAAVLSVIAGSDPRDPATAEAGQHATDYTRFLDPAALRGKRIGVVRALTGYDARVDRILEQSIAALRQAGAVVVDPVELPHLHDFGNAENTVLLYEFKHDLNAYLATRRGLKVKSLADIIAFDKAHAADEMPWFGQELFLAAEAMGPLTDQAYADALAKAKRLSGPEGIDAALAAHHLDALLAPVQGPAWVTDHVDGDHVSGNAYSASAVAGYPSITVPAGYVHGLPVGMLFFAGRWSEPTLIGIGYAFEQATHAWTPPHFYATAPLQDAQPAASDDSPDPENSDTPDDTDTTPEDLPATDTDATPPANESSAPAPAASAHGY